MDERVGDNLAYHDIRYQFLFLAQCIFDDLILGKLAHYESNEPLEPYGIPKTACLIETCFQFRCPCVDDNTSRLMGNIWEILQASCEEQCAKPTNGIGACGLVDQVFPNQAIEYSGTFRRIWQLEQLEQGLGIKKFNDMLTIQIAS